MDTRIEELAEIIIERCEAFIKPSLEAREYKGEDCAAKFRTYKRIQWLAIEMLESIHAYRIGNPDEYK